MYQHILLTLDFSHATDSYVKKAVELAKIFNSKLSFLHVIEPIKTYGYPIVTDRSREHIDFAKSEIERYTKGSDIKIAKTLIESGSPKHVIHDVAEKLDVDLIIVGSHNRHGIARLLGSTANAVNNLAECDVITFRVPQSDEEDIVTFGDGIYQK